MEIENIINQTRKYASDGQGTFEDVVKAIKILYSEKFNVSVRINLIKKIYYHFKCF